jgi:hypothetical protein
VSSAATLAGVTPSVFSATAQAAFVATLAATLRVAAPAVSITGMAAASAPASGGRALHVDAPPPAAAAARAAFEIATTAAPEALMAGVTALSADATAFATALQAAGLAGLTGVTVAPPVLSVRAPAVPHNFTSAAAQSDFLAALVSDVSEIVAADASSAQAVSLVAAAADALNAASSQLGASAAAGVRASLLAAIADTAGGASTPLALQSVADAVARLVANASQVNGESVNASLSLLQAVSAATTNRGVVITNATAFAVAASLSSIVAAVALHADGDGGGSNATAPALQRCLGVVTSLAASALASLGQNIGDALEVASPAVQMRVAVDDAASAGAPLYTQGVSAPGAPSAFGPLPLDLFAAAGINVSAGVRTVFAALAFDPYGGGIGGGGNTSGVTRLEFSSASSGETIEVGNLSTPVYFTLPAPANLSAGGVKAACQFYDVAANAFSAQGCAEIPSPAPAEHTLSWAPGFMAASDADMAAAWSIAGNLTANCASQVLDCGAASPPAIFTNPFNAFGAPVVTCAPDSMALMLVFTGADCALIKADNTFDCAWSNERQAFTGAGCVAPAAGAPVRCACRHVRGPASVWRWRCPHDAADHANVCAPAQLTDFAAARKPSIPVASLSDLTSFPASDIVTKLRTLFIIVCSLFGAMLAGAAVGLAMDRASRRRIMRRLCAPEAGFVAIGDGGPDGNGATWLWAFRLDPLMDELCAPSGTAVALCAVFGTPYARLRAALPDEFFDDGAGMGTAVGRRSAFSRQAMDAALLLPSWTLAKGSCCGDASPSVVKRGVAVLEAAVSTDASSDGTAANAEDTLSMPYFLGTALVLAFLQVCQLAPVRQLASLRAAAAAHFAGVRSPAGWTFADTTTAFLTLLSPGVLSSRRNWLSIACLWKLLLSQSTAGCWDASASVAFGLHARARAEVAELQPGCWARAKERLLNLGETGAELAEGLADAGRVGDTVMRLAAGGRFEDDNAGDAHGGAGTRASEQRQLPDDMAPEERRRSSVRLSLVGGGSASRKLRAQRSARLYGARDEDDATPLDDPLTCSAHSVAASMPRRLAALADGNGGDALDAQLLRRLWATLCCIAALERLPHCWIWGDGDLYMPQQMTVVDAARVWGEATAAQHPRLAAALADGAPAAAAARTVRAWKAAWVASVADLRRADALKRTRLRSQLDRAATSLWHALVTKHETAACFLSEPLDGLQRWQMWMIIMTLVLSQLLVNIWCALVSHQLCVHSRPRGAGLHSNGASPRRIPRQDVLRERRELLRGGARHPGRDALLHRRAGRMRGRVRHAAARVRRRAGAGLPGRPGGLHLHRLSGRRRAERHRRRGAHQPRHRAARGHLREQRF